MYKHLQKETSFLCLNYGYNTILLQSGHIYDAYIKNVLIKALTWGIQVQNENGLDESLAQKGKQNYSTDISQIIIQMIYDYRVDQNRL